MPASAAQRGKQRYGAASARQRMTGLLTILHSIAGAVVTSAWVAQLSHEDVMKRRTRPPTGNKSDWNLLQNLRVLHALRDEVIDFETEQAAHGDDARPRHNAP